jgi:hypothetical protein
MLTAGVSRGTAAVDRRAPQQPAPPAAYVLCGQLTNILRLTSAQKAVDVIAFAAVIQHFNHFLKHALQVPQASKQPLLSFAIYANAPFVTCIKRFLKAISCTSPLNKLYSRCIIYHICALQMKLSPCQRNIQSYTPHKLAQDSCIM